MSGVEPETSFLNADYFIERVKLHVHPQIQYIKKNRCFLFQPLSFKGFLKLGFLCQTL